MNADDERVAAILPVAADLADAVDHCDADRIAALLHALDTDALYALAVVLAANVEVPLNDDRREPDEVDEVLVWRVLAGDRALAGIATKSERAEVMRRWPSTGKSLNELEAITGWNSARERRRAAACGTDSGYYRHLRTLKEPACDSCKAAHREVERQRAERRSA